MRYRPKRENYAIGQFGEIDYKERLERYCTYLENKNKQLHLHVVGCSFLDELIEKHKANKKLALINCEKMKGSKDFPWYDATFNNELLFVWDLEDLKIRLGL
jgi:hypothetical protein